MFGLSPAEMLVVGVVAVLLFGSRLPSVARSMGKSLTEFKRGMQGVEDDFREAVNSEPTGRMNYEQHRTPSAPAFEPPKAAEAARD